MASNETRPQQQSRRDRDRQRRESETPEERRRRLDRLKEYRKRKRESETQEDADIRRSKQRQQQRQRRELEDEQVRESRVSQMRKYVRTVHSDETPEARAVRLQQKREHAQSVHREETPETRLARLQQMRDHAQATRSEETAEARAARLLQMREHAQTVRSDESQEARENRLERMRISAQQQEASRLVQSRYDGITDSCPVFGQNSVQRKIAKFHSKLAECAFFECSTCSESFPSIKASKSNECARCLRDKKKQYSRDNGMDPGPVPLELQGLTQVEEMLISAVMPMMSLYRLPMGQYGYSGHVVNLPQNVSSFVTSLPRLASDIDVILVRKEGASGSHKDFRVRRSKILCALQWLKQNNRYYQDITLDESALAQLPEDGDLSELTTITLPVDDDDHTINNPSDGDGDTFMSGTFVPMVPKNNTEQQVMRQSISDRQHADEANRTVQWPQVEDSPINEFRTEGYMTRAFPTLFPTGEADFAAPRVHKVTIGAFFKHLMMYKDGRFAKHPRFRYFALNTEMRWRALQAGNIYVRQHTSDAQLTVQELREMVGGEGEAFSSRVMRFATSLRGTSPYWFKQRSRLIAMVDTLGLPTVFFTHSAADLQWPELAHLICPEDPENRNKRSQALLENPAIADWFFYQRVRLFMKDFYEEVLGVRDYWLRFEWQHRGSPHVHGLAWLSDAPSIEQGVIPEASTLQEITRYVDKVVSTINPAIHEDGSNASDAPLPQVDPHVCNKPFAGIENYEEDLKKLIATCQRHTRCSPSYCLKIKHGQQQCRFGYPKPLQQVTTLSRNEDGDIELLTKRNDPLINSFNPIQLSAWRANVDMQYCISKNKVIAYCAKYATKSEPRSLPLKQVYKSVVGTLKDDDHALKAVHRLLTNSVGERDYSAQETCHLLLQLPLVMSSREFVYLTLDGTCMVEEKLDEDEPATIKSCLDHYISRPTTHQFESCTLTHFAQNYSIPREGGEPKPRNKKVVVIVRPHISPDPDGPNYEQYCKQRLMLYKPFRNETELLNGHDSFTEAYADYLHTGNVQSCLWDDIHRLEQAAQGGNSEGEDSDEGEAYNGQGSRTRNVEEWMLICQHRAQLGDNGDASIETVDWLEAGRRYPNIEEAPSFIARSKESHTPGQSSLNSPDSHLLQGKQLQAYQAVKQHYQQKQLNMDPQPLCMIVSGTAGTGKSFLIGCLKELLKDKVRLLAPTGVAAFNIHGCTLHSVLRLPTKGELKNLEGDALRRLQDSLAGVEYIIIDEMSMVGRKMFGQIDHRLRQAFPQCADQVLGGRSCLLFGDFGQLPPVMDLPLYTSVSRSSISDLGRSAYQSFNKAVVLTQVMRQSGQDEEQVRFREILLHLRDASVTKEDWEHLMTRREGQVANKEYFSQALHLLPTVDAVAAYNLDKLRHNGQPVAEIRAIHNGPRANTATSDEAGGLDSVVYIAQGARVMLTSNLWVDAGLVNGAMGTVQAICYQSGGPPDLPTAVMVSFDSYSGPTMHDGSVPIVPIRRSWMSGGATCSRLQLPLKLAWAVTIHKSQGLTLGKAVVDIGSKEFCAGLTFVACSRVRCLSDLMFSTGFDFDRISSIANNVRLQERRAEDSRLQSLQ